MKRYLLLFIAVLALTTSAFTQKMGGLEIGQSVPNFKLINQQGHGTQLQDFRGKVVVVSFLFTRCPDANKCPLLAAKLEKLQYFLNKTEETRGRVQLVSITLDPKYDSPEVLTGYANLHHAASNWTFLTGKSRDIVKIAGLFGEMYFDERGSVVHNTRTSVLDPDQRLRKVFNNNDWKMAEMAGVVRDLLDK